MLRPRRAIIAVAACLLYGCIDVSSSGVRIQTGSGVPLTSSGAGELWGAIIEAPERITDTVSEWIFEVQTRAENVSQGIDKIREGKEQVKKGITGR